MKKMTGIEMSARKKTCWLGSVLCYHFRFFKKAISYLFFLYNSLLIFLNMQRNLEGKKKIQTTNSLVYGQCISWQGLYFYYSKRTMLRNVGELEKKNEPFGLIDLGCAIYSKVPPRFAYTILAFWSNYHCETFTGTPHFHR